LAVASGKIKRKKFLGCRGIFSKIPLTGVGRAHENGGAGGRTSCGV